MVIIVAKEREGYVSIRFMRTDIERWGAVLGQLDPLPWLELLPLSVETVVGDCTIHVIHSPSKETGSLFLHTYIASMMLGNVSHDRLRTEQSKVETNRSVDRSIIPQGRPLPTL